MARKQVKDKARSIENWTEAEAAMAEYAVMETSIEREEAAYNHDEQKRREKLTEKHSPLRESMAEIEQGMKAFCVKNRSDFGGKQTKELTHADVGFRLGPPKVERAKGFTFDGVVDLLKQAPEDMRGLFIRTKDELNKEAIIANNARAADPAADPSTYVSPDILREQFRVFVTQEETFGITVKKAVETV